MVLDGLQLDARRPCRVGDSILIKRVDLTWIGRPHILRNNSSREVFLIVQHRHAFDISANHAVYRLGIALQIFACEVINAMMDAQTIANRSDTFFIMTYSYDMRQRPFQKDIRGFFFQRGHEFSSAFLSPNDHSLNSQVLG